MIKIEASILSADFARLGEQAREAESAEVEAIHVDVMDGRFVPVITFIIWKFYEDSRSSEVSTSQY